MTQTLPQRLEREGAACCDHFTYPLDWSRAVQSSKKERDKGPDSGERSEAAPSEGMVTRPLKNNSSIAVFLCYTGKLTNSQELSAFDPLAKI